VIRWSGEWEGREKGRHSGSAVGIRVEGKDSKYS
jgi:hypothetical protein